MELELFVHQWDCDAELDGRSGSVFIISELVGERRRLFLYLRQIKSNTNCLI
jgi:hypothetical protein